MADWSKETVTKSVARWTVPAAEPWGGTWNQLDQALNDAHSYYKSKFGKVPSDDAIRVHVGEGAVILEMELPETPVVSPPAAKPEFSERAYELLSNAFSGYAPGTADYFTAREIKRKVGMINDE